jgi:hypothetical protein
MKKLFAFLLFICFVHVIQAQTGEIKGRVKDPRTAYGIPNVTVILLHDTTRLLRKPIKTDVDGNYTITNLPPAKYDVAWLC